MKIHFLITPAMTELSATTRSPAGYCILWGAEAGGIEPDTRRHECDSCGQRGVYGGEALLPITAV